MIVLLFVLFQLTDERDIAIEELRDLFFKSEESKHSCEMLTSRTKEINEESLAIEMGYKGMAHMMMAKYKKSPFKKLKHFKHGKKWIGLGLAKDPNSIEIRFLRLTVQENLPFFLGYRGEKEEDRSYVTAHLHEVPDGFLKDKMVEYLNKTE